MLPFHYIFNSLVIIQNILLSRLVNTVRAEDHCIWYGDCGESPEKEGMHINCEYTGPAKPAQRETKSILKKWCPHYFYREGGDSISTCCDDAQMKIFESSIQQAAVLIAKCPSCETNFVEYICEFTCRHDQSRFITVLNTTKTPAGEGITEINLCLSKKFAYATYKSCKDIYMPLANQYVMDILCGRPVVSCSPEAWFRFLGDVQSFAPFQINYLLSDVEIKGLKPMDIKAYACNETSSPDSDACSCLDCPDSCPVDHHIYRHDPIRVGDLYLSQFLIILIYIGGLGGIIYLLVKHHRMEMSKKHSNVIVKVGLNRHMCTTFYF
ncbi:hypothetical protein RUM44_008971 [Polyplax serrata]|uniref:Niemann-Pick C1 N-terminal domain-containing protein n=1 Tax=Polyplax serrata TaxID=468196 RepID=A0ABR1ASV7_POLSC